MSSFKLLLAVLVLSVVLVPSAVLLAQEPSPKHYRVCVDVRGEALCSVHLFDKEDATKAANMLSTFPFLSEPIRARVEDVNAPPSVQVPEHKI